MKLLFLQEHLIQTTSLTIDKVLSLSYHIFYDIRYPTLTSYITAHLKIAS